MKGFKQAQADYENRMMNPYDYYEDEYDEDDYYNHVEQQLDTYMEDLQ